MAAFARLDSRQVVLDILDEIGCSIGSYAAYTRYNRWTCERILRGERAIDHAEALALETIARDLKKARDTFQCDLDWRDVRGISAVLRRWREQEQVRQN